MFSFVSDYIFGGSSTDKSAADDSESKRPSEDEKTESKQNPKADDQKMNGDYPALDLVFLMDCTGSMGSYIAKGKASIMDIAEKVKASEKADVRFSYIAYRDHPPQDQSLITKVHDFTTDPRTMRNYLSLYQAQGGGDGPEAVAEALHDALSLDYRKNAIKICVLIADAPPHGIGVSGDGFPNGNPNGHDPVKIAQEMAERGIILYVVACEPSLSGYTGAHDLMAGLAEITEGRYLPLTGAHLLPNVIIGGAKEEVSLQKLQKFVEDEMEQIKAQEPTIKKEEMNARIASKMKASGMTHCSNMVEDEQIYGAYDRSNISAWASASSLQDGRKKQKVLAQPKANFAHVQEQRSEMCEMDFATTSKLMSRVNKQSKNSYW